MGFGKTVYTKAPNGLDLVNGMYRMNTRRGVNMRLLGMAQLEENLGAATSKVHFASMNALLEIGAYVERDMHHTYPTIPKDTGAMAARYRTVPEYGMIHHKNGKVDADPGKNRVQLGWASASFTDKETGKTQGEYAAYVHEMTSPPYENPINWTVPGSGPKFFESAIKRNQGVMLEIVKRDLRKSLGL